MSNPINDEKFDIVGSLRLREKINSEFWERVIEANSYRVKAEAHKDTEESTSIPVSGMVKSLEDKSKKQEAELGRIRGAIAVNFMAFEGAISNSENHIFTGEEFSEMTTFQAFIKVIEFLDKKSRKTDPTD